MPTIAPLTAPERAVLLSAFPALLPAGTSAAALLAALEYLWSLPFNSSIEVGA